MKVPETKIAVTLFNLRDYCKTYEDLDKTLGRVKSIGYEAIQISGIGPIPPEQVKELLDKHQLYVCATHEGYQPCIDDIDAIIAKLKLWECEFTAVGSVPGSLFTREGVDEAAAQLEKIGAAFRAEGIKFGYHNHHHEFLKITDKTWLTELYERTTPENLYAELDLHWVARGGGNPEAWIRALDGRIDVIHFKDFAFEGGEPRFCEIGEGNLDWPGILKACEDTGVRWYSIEQDQPFGDKDIFESIKISFDNLKKMGVK